MLRFERFSLFCCRSAAVSLVRRSESVSDSFPLHSCCSAVVCCCESESIELKAWRIQGFPVTVRLLTLLLSPHAYVWPGFHGPSFLRVPDSYGPSFLYWDWFWTVRRETMNPLQPQPLFLQRVHTQNLWFYSLQNLSYTYPIHRDSLQPPHVSLQAISTEPLLCVPTESPYTYLWFYSLQPYPLS